jgi:hypothetical protein
MTPNQLTAVMDQYLGGSEGRTRHYFNPRLIFTEGVKAVADAAGAYWLLDIVATEVAPICLRMWEQEQEHMAFLHVQVAHEGATLWLDRDMGEPRLWERRIEFTDFPTGNWMFYLAIDGIVDPSQDVVVAMLPQEY